MLTPEQTYHQCVANFARQNFETASDDNECRYRTDTGLACAAGGFIKDEDYDETMEGETVDQLPEGTFGEADLDTLGLLQACHDQCVFANGDLKADLRAFGLNYGFSIPEVLS